MLAASGIATADPAFRLTADLLHQYLLGAVLQGNWKYHPGNDPKYAETELEDHDWVTVAEPWNLPESWNGTGWFRIHLSADPDLVQVPLAISARLAGSADVYLNGKLLRSYSGHPLFAADRSACYPCSIEVSSNSGGSQGLN